MLQSKFNDSGSIFNLEVNEHTKNIFLNMARWTKFLAILGFIFMGIMLTGLVLVVIFSQTNFSQMDDSLKKVMVGEAIGLCIASVGISFYPAYTLLQYSLKIKKAFTAASQDAFETAINALKNTFKYVSIMMIISLFTTCISFIAMVIGLMKTLMAQ